MRVPQLTYPKFQQFRNHQFVNSTLPWRPFQTQVYEEASHPDVPENHIVWGSDYFDSDELVTTYQNPEKRITILLVGRNGAGKSIEQKNIVYDNLFTNFNRYVIDISPKLDVQTIIWKNNNPHYINILNKYGFSPKCYSPYLITPEYLKIGGAKGKKYSLSIKEINDLIALSPQTGFSILCNLFNSAEKDATAAALDTIFLSNPHPPTSMQETENSINSYLETENSRLTNLPIQFNILKLGKRLTDEYISYPQLINQNKILGVELEIGSTKDNNMQALCVDQILRTCLQDRKRSILSGGKEGYINKIPTISIDEGEAYAAPSSTTYETVQQVLTKFREILPAQAHNNIITAGADLVLSTQHISFLDEYYVAQVDYILTPQLKSQKDAHLLASRGVSPENIYRLQTLPYPESPPVPFGLICPNNSVRFFVPLPTRSWMR